MLGQSRPFLQGFHIPQSLVLETEIQLGTEVIHIARHGCPSLHVGAHSFIIGNVALYGATSGKAFINGMAGERFAVRNSGACAVVEGVGDHGCEYMTGGRCVILGPTGKNFAAGMSGGIAYVWDEDRDLYLRLNKALVTVDPVTERQDIQEIRTMLTEHVEATGSPKAREILDHLEEKAACFKKIVIFLTCFYCNMFSPARQ